MNLLIMILLTLTGTGVSNQNTIDQSIFPKHVSIMETSKEDSLLIRQALENYYFKGIYEGDTSLLDKIYYKGTLLFGDVKGKPYAKTLEEYITGVQNRQSPKESGKPFKGEILSVHIVNSIAVAEVKVKMYDFHYHEFLSFHKINGTWLIVNKMISDTSN
ncbi:MAG TPA: nuclear transport factor 2 family protein [Ohtaekwangia sp.]|uniref:nuclear transport factor 2 family protein n=1 Tax=Ohtaekwangia sp. TaxID=2066019 RepID=UPI002F9296FA